MTGSRQPGNRAVAWLTGQSVLFGAMAALLGVVANAIFLEAYGSGWLPATYIAIGVAGVVLSGIIARATQRFDLLRLAVAVLGSAAVLLLLSWPIATTAGGAWVSIPLLVLFPILIQLGFVFIGGQAGRILDIAGIKASFPRIMTGFPVGAVLGGLLGVPLVDLTGRSEDLLLATALVQAAFAGLVWATGRRFAALLVLPPPAPVQAGTEPEPSEETSLRRLFGRPFVVLVLAYQVLSALGSQIADFLVFDRAAAAYPAAEDLARFVSVYTAVMNAASIGFLFLVAGPLLRRFGLRLGIASNPLVLTLFAAAMALVLVGAGAASFALLAVVAAGRIADIALTDGTTRTSINALYQVLPARARIGVQTAVEGIGVPLAIGVSGVLILVLNALPGRLVVTITILALVCAAWTWVGLRLYAAYGPALVEAIRRTRLLDPEAAFEVTVADAAVARSLLVGGDPRSTRLGLEIASMVPSRTLALELRALADDPRPDVRLAALTGLAASGDARSRARLAAEVRVAAASTDPAERRRAASLTGVLDPTDRAAAARLLVDDAPEVRAAALAAVQAGDVHALGPAVVALRDPRTATAAIGAIRRLGDAAVPALATVLDARDPSEAVVAMRMLRAVSAPSEARDGVLERHLQHHDRQVGLLVLQRLGDAGPAAGPRAAALDEAIAADAGHAARVLLALAAGTDGDADPLARALRDELDLGRARIVAALAARHGARRIGAALAHLGGDDDRAALAAEALEVEVGQSTARLALALASPGLSADERLRRLAASGVPVPSGRDIEGWLREIIEDPGDRWRSPWLRACAIRAARVAGLLPELDVEPARRLGDAVVDEELAPA